MQYWCDCGFNVTFQIMDQNHVKVKRAEFFVQIAVEKIIQNSLKNCSIEW